jgi:hypothetical protein
VIIGMSPGVIIRVIGFHGILACKREMINTQLDIQMGIQIQMSASVMFTRHFLRSVALIALQWAIWHNIV